MDASPSIDLSAYVEIQDGRAQVRGRRLPVAFVAAAAREQKASVDTLAYQFSLSKEEVLAVLLYYHEHQAAVDAQDAADAEESHRLHQRYRGQPRKRS